MINALKKMFFPDYEITVDHLTPEKDTQGQVYSFLAELMYLDDLYPTENGALRKGAVLECLNPVSVMSGHRQIGSANLFIESNILYCDVFIDFESPERLDIESQLRDLYMELRGFTRVKDDKTFQRVIAVCVDSLEITAKKPGDPRIKKL